MRMNSHRYIILCRIGHQDRIVTQIISNCYFETEMRRVVGFCACIGCVRCSVRPFELKETRMGYVIAYHWSQGGSMRSTLSIIRSKIVLHMVRNMSRGKHGSSNRSLKKTC
jgi:hypothetical protein